MKYFCSQTTKHIIYVNCLFLSRVGMGVGALILSVFKDLPEKRILNHTNHKNHFKHRKGEKRDERRRTL